MTDWQREADKLTEPERTGGLTKEDGHQLEQWVRASDAFRSTYIKKYQRARSDRMMEVSDGQPGRETRARDSESQVDINLIQGAMRDRVARLMSRNPRFNADVAPDPLDEDAWNDDGTADMVSGERETAALRWWWRILGGKQTFRSVIGDTFDAGRGIVMVNYVTDAEIVALGHGTEEQTKDQMPDEKDGKIVEYRRLISESVNFWRVKPEDILFDHNATDPMDGQRYGYRRRRPFVDMLASKGFFSNGPILDTKRVRGLATASAAYDGPIDYATHQAIDELPTIEIWDKRSLKRYLYIEGFWDAPLHVWAGPEGGDGWLPGCISAGGAPRFNLIIIEPSRDNDKLYPRPDHEDAMPLQEGVNTLVNQLFVYLANAVPGLLAERGLHDPDDLIRAYNATSGGITFLDSIAGILPKPHGQIPSEIFAGIDVIQRLFDTSLRQSRASQGQVEEGGITATEAKLITQGSEAQSDMDADVVEDALKDCGELVLRIAQANQGLRKIAPVVPSERKAYAPFFATEMRADVIVSLEGGGTRYVDKQATKAEAWASAGQWIELFGPGTPMDSAGGGISAPKLRDWLIERTDQDAENLVPDFNPEQEAARGELDMMLGQGMGGEDAIVAMAKQIEAIAKEEAAAAREAELAGAEAGVKDANREASTFDALDGGQA